MRTSSLRAIMMAAAFIAAMDTGARPANGVERSNALGAAELTLRLWLIKAERGDPTAQYLVGFKYVRGDGVQQNWTEAARWLRASSDQGYPDAQWSLGTLYELGFGVSQNYAEAFRLYHLAASQGVVEAKTNLGLYYLEGLGTEQNSNEAYRWLRAASRQGVGEAETGLGRIHEEGLGRPIDLVRAYMWYSLAADTGARNSPAYRDALAKKLTPSELNDANLMALGCTRSDFEDCD